MAARFASFLIGALCGAVILVAAIAFLLPSPDGRSGAVAVGGADASSPRFSIPEPAISLAALAPWRDLSTAEIDAARRADGPAADLNVLLALSRGDGPPDDVIVIATLGQSTGDPLAALSSFSATMAAFSWFDWAIGGDLEVATPGRAFDLAGSPAAAFAIRATDPAGARKEIAFTIVDLPLTRVVLISAAKEETGAAAEAAAIVASLEN